MSVSRLEYLLNLYVRQDFTEAEEKELMALMSNPENEAELKILMDDVIEQMDDEISIPATAAASILQNVLGKDMALAVPPENKKRIFTRLMRVAAAVLLLLTGSLYWFFIKTENPKAKMLQVVEKTALVLPGSNRAFLTMADGSRITLDSSQNEILQQGKIKINKHGGMLIYGTAASSAGREPVAYNTLSTPRGGQFQLVLPDGTKVWLNASSSLTFPTAFTGKLRQVELKGEAYFEIAKDSKKAFRVKVDDMDINVLGTHFDVDAYGDENSIKTSLMEGSVKISRGRVSNLLAPGEQAILNKQENRIEIKNADMEEVIAWKNGLFQFQGAGITTIMQQIGRWYDVEIVYEGKIPVRSFEGKISRQARLSEVLQILALSNVKFTMEGKKIIVR